MGIIVFRRDLRGNKLDCMYFFLLLIAYLLITGYSGIITKQQGRKMVKWAKSYNAEIQLC